MTRRRRPGPSRSVILTEDAPSAVVALDVVLRDAIKIVTFADDG
jgi:hypothetical protein